MSPRPESERSDWTDLDLLTRDEARERLQQEIAEIEQSPSPDNERLKALRAAVEDLTA